MSQLTGSRQARALVRMQPILALLLLHGAAGVPPASARVKTGPHAAPSTPGHRQEGAAPSIPDTVLAVIGAARPGEPGRTVGRSRFARAWTQLQPPTRPDSLTPAGARRFLELLLDKEALGLAAARERWAWTEHERTAFGALRDRLVVEAMLDSALTATRRALGARGDSLDRQSLGLAARDSALARLAPVFDDSLVVRLARAFAALKRPTADSSLMAQIRVLGASPELDPSDTGRVLARTTAGEYRVGDLLSAWRRLNPLYRPRIETAAQLRDLVANGIFERLLRRAGEAGGIERRADIAAALANQREFNDVSHLVAREVYARIATDSLTLLRFYHATERDWEVPLRVRLLRVQLPDRTAADAMALRLASPAAADSLAASARRAGVEYVVEVSAGSDSALFHDALSAGTGAVLGPDEREETWSVARVEAVLPGRRRAFGEVRDLVHHRWYSEEGERLMRALVERARAALRSRINEAALDALVRDPPAELQAR